MSSFVENTTYKQSTEIVSNVTQGNGNARYLARGMVSETGTSTLCLQLYHGQEDLMVIVIVVGERAFR